MSYISVSEEEGAEPIELPTEEDGTGQWEDGFLTKWKKHGNNINSSNRIISADIIVVTNIDKKFYKF